MKNQDMLSSHMKYNYLYVQLNLTIFLLISLRARVIFFTPLISVIIK